MPKGAYANGSDGNQVFVQTIEIEFAGHTPAVADFLQVDIPADLSIADIDNDGNYDDEVSLNWNTVLNPTFAVDAAQTDANIIVIDVGTAVAIAATEKLIIVIPVESEETPSVGSDNYILTFLDANAIAAEGETHTLTVTYEDQLSLLDWDDNYFEDTGGDGRLETDNRGKYHPDPSHATLPGPSTVVDGTLLPNLVVDVDAAQKVVSANIASWAATSANIFDATDANDVKFYLWASTNGSLAKITEADAERVVDYDPTATLDPKEWPPSFDTQDFNTGASQTGYVAAYRLLPEDDWFFYVTSDITGDWALGRSDTIEVRHYPVFSDYLLPDGTGLGYDDTWNGVWDPGGTDGLLASFTLESGGTIGTNGLFNPTTNQNYVDIYWDVEDVDDNAYVHVFKADVATLDVDDVTTSDIGGGSLWVTGLGDGEQIHTDTLREEGATGYKRFNTFTSSADYEDAGIFYFYVVLNDLKHQTVRVVDDNVPAAVDVTVQHYSYFAFHPYYPFYDDVTPELPFNSATSRYLIVSWGNSPAGTDNIDGDTDLDAEGTATIKLYAVDATALTGDHATIIGANPLSTAALQTAVDAGNGYLIASLVDNADDREDNRYEWDVRAAGLDQTLNWNIYAVMAHGTDPIVVQLNTDGQPSATGFLSGKEDDMPVNITNDDYLRAVTPYAGPPVELGGNDQFELRWEGFNVDPGITSANVRVQAVLAKEGADNPGSASYDTWVTATYQTADFIWLLGSNAGDLPTTGADALAADGVSSTIIDISDYTATADAAAPSAGNYYVYYFFTSDGTMSTEAAVQAPGMVYLTGETTTEYNIEVWPQKSVIVTDDTLTFAVYAKDDPSAENPAMIRIFLDIPNASLFSIIDQDAATAGIQPFDDAGTFGGAVLINTLSTSGSTYQLNFLNRRDTGIPLAALTKIAEFQVALTSYPSQPFEDLEVIFSTEDPRETNLYDLDGSPQSTSIPPVALLLKVGQLGSISGFTDVEGITDDQGEEVSFIVTPTGSLTPITNSAFLSANGDADGSDGVQVTLGTVGSYTLSGLPTGEYDVKVHKSGYLDVIYENISIAGLESKTLHFTGGNKLFGGDAAGFDDDGDDETPSLPDNRVTSDDTDAISDAFGASSGSANWNAYADIDGSGEVDINDLIMASKNYGEDGEGIFYKVSPILDGTNEDAVVWLARADETAEGITFVVSAKALASLQGYAIKMFIPSKDWEVVSVSDLLLAHTPTINLSRFDGPNARFASAILGANAVTLEELELVSFVLKPMVAHPADPAIAEVILADRNLKLTKAIIGSEMELVPVEYSLNQNYPNPFNPTTSIRFGLPDAGYVRLAVYNLLGQEVCTLVSGTMEPGSYQVAWNSRDNLGRKVTSGMYFYRLVVDNKVIDTKKMILLQ
ncbi:MAG: T9SS type A sorting domain-containing protein [Candidatus Neomarinimicrobiota bacterium]